VVKSARRSSSPARSLSAERVDAVALYARVSTDDQAENDTVDAQLEFLRGLAAAYKWTIVGEYVDEGVSGTIPLDRRPDGRRLLSDAEEGRFAVVVCTRVSRLGRKLDVALDAYDALATHGISLRCAQESIDTSQPGGELLFGILGSFAQHDHRTIVEQTARGKVRVAAKGRYTGGPIPIGLDLDNEGNYLLSTRPVPQIGKEETEATMMRGIFERVAARQTTAYEEFRRLVALGVPGISDTGARLCGERPARTASRSPTRGAGTTPRWCGHYGTRSTRAKVSSIHSTDRSCDRCRRWSTPRRGRGCRWRYATTGSCRERMRSATTGYGD